MEEEKRQVDPERMKKYAMGVFGSLAGAMTSALAWRVPWEAAGAPAGPDQGQTGMPSSWGRQAKALGARSAVLLSP